MSREELRLSKFKLKEVEEPVEIIVNTNYRHGIGFRAAIKGQPGKWGDSLSSVEEAIGNLFKNWLLDQTQ